MRLKQKNLKQKLAKILDKFCFTFDCCIAHTNIDYTSLTAHYLDNDWMSKSKILSFVHMQPLYNRYAFSLKLVEFLKRLENREKRRFLSLWVMHSNDNMQNILKEHLCLSNILLLSG